MKVPLRSHSRPQRVQERIEIMDFSNRRLDELIDIQGDLIQFNTL